jgi:hypothetical protein
MKLEYKNIEIGIFITPKVYYLRLSNNEEIMKAKTINNIGLTYEDYLKLYNGFSIKKFEERWYSNIKNENVIIKKVGIDINPDVIIRSKIFSLGKWIVTLPVVIYHKINNTIRYYS